MQFVGPQLVPFGTFEHEPTPMPLPEQAASWPQAFDVSSVQSPFGLVPALAGPQVPSPLPDCFVAAEQASHVFEQPVSQQTPSTQWFDWHCELAEQGWPLPAWFWQWPALQFIVEQSAPVAHVEGQLGP